MVNGKQEQREGNRKFSYHAQLKLSYIRSNMKIEFILSIKKQCSSNVVWQGVSPMSTHGIKVMLTYSLDKISVHMTCLCRSLTMRRVPLQRPFFGLLFLSKVIVAPT